MKKLNKLCHGVLVVNKKSHVMHTWYKTSPQRTRVCMHGNAKGCLKACLKGQHGMKDMKG